MKLSELIAEYGDDNIIFQNLDTDMISMDKRKNYYEIKFGTKEGFNQDLSGTNKRALIVWMDRDKTQEILDKNKGKQDE